MQVLNGLVQLDTSSLRIDVGRRPFSVEYCFQSPSPMTPEQIETFCLYGSKVAENGDILLTETAPENIDARVRVADRFTSLATGMGNPDASIELLSEGTTTEEVVIFTKCLEQALSYA